MKRIILAITILLILLVIMLIIFSANTPQQLTSDCNSFNYTNCPNQCAVCPPCAWCSSVSCQTETFCNNLGFDKNWFNSVKPK